MNILHAGAGIQEFRIFRDLFARWGFPLHAVTSGQDAMRRLRSERPPDLLLIDRALPGMDGFSLARWTRSHLAPRPPRMVILSEPGGEFLSVLARDSGADALLIKPIRPERLREQMAYAEIGMRHTLDDHRRRFASTRSNLRAVAG